MDMTNTYKKLIVFAASILTLNAATVPAVAATFDTNGNHQFTFTNHSDTPVSYDLKPATGKEISGVVEPGQTVESESVESGGDGTMQQGSVPVITIEGARIPNFRFWSGSEGQYINALAENGYRVTKDTSEISEVTGDGYRVTVDGGGEESATSNIHVRIYNE